MSRSSEQSRPVSVGFLLASGFAELHLDIASEALRIANRVSGRDAFETGIFTVGDRPAVANSGRVLRPDRPLARAGRPDALFVIAGLEPESVYEPSVATRLRKLDRHGCLLGAIDTGAVFLAEAGLVDDQLVAIHWEYEPVFKIRYPRISTTSRGYVWSGRRLTCSGGLSVGDMMIEFTRRLDGETLARRLADMLNFEGSIRVGELFHAPNNQNIASRAVALMRANLEEPLGLQELAGTLQVHAKTLARAFHKHHGEPPMVHYRKLRLERGRDLLLYGNFTVKQAAYATGFSSTAHFSTAFRSIYGFPPGQVLRDGRQS